MSTLKRLNSALPSASMLVAILALVVAAAGAGYAAGKIGTGQIKNNAVTSPKVKNGALKAADLVKEQKFKYIGGTGAPDYRNGGQGDCVWQPGSALAPGFSRPGFRKDRFGTVHLVGLALPSDGPGGDGSCDSGVEADDAIAFVLPAAYRPAKTLLRPLGSDGTVIVVGRNALIAPGVSLPAGTVAVAGTAGTPLLIDGISYQPAGSRLVSGRSTDRVTPAGRSVLRGLGLG